MSEEHDAEAAKEAHEEREALAARLGRIEAQLEQLTSQLGKR